MLRVFRNSELRIGALYTLGGAVLWMLVAITNPLVDLNENQTLYIFSSISQVVAGVYGLTIAGYVFLRDQQNRIVDKDETLHEIFERIQRSQHDQLLFITALSLSAIFLSLITIAFRESPITLIKGITSNVACCLFAATLAWIAYFVIDVTNPNKVSNISKKIKDEVVNPSTRHKEDEEENDLRSEDDYDVSSVPTNETNFLGEFLLNFNNIERFLIDFAESNLGRTNQIKARNYANSSSSFEQKPYGVRWTPAKTVRALVSEEKITKVFAEEILDIIRYRNALVHGNDLTVSESMVLRVKDAYKRLVTALNIDNDDGSLVEGGIQ